MNTTLGVEGGDLVKNVKEVQPLADDVEAALGLRTG
jgi:hypothetical protein